MSQSEAEAAGREEIWVEKYRPQTLDEVVGQEDIVARLQSYVARNDLPNLLFSGGAGIGKCVTGETPVLTNRGVAEIGELVGEIDGFEEPDSDLEVLTFDDTGAFEYTKPSHVYSKTAEATIRVETRDGADLTVTPEHRLLVISDAGIEWKRAEELDVGDRVVRPLDVPTPETKSEIDWFQAMDGDRTLVEVTDDFAQRYEIPAEEDYVGAKKRVLRGLRRGESVKTTIEDTGVPRKTVTNYRREANREDLNETTTTCSLSYLRELEVSDQELREHVKRMRYVTPQNRRSSAIEPVWETTPDLLWFIGFALSEAYLDNGRLKCYNTNETLLSRFERVAVELFGVDAERGEQRGVSYVSVRSRTLTHYLESCFDAFDGATGGRGIGSTIVMADEVSRAAFLQAVFDAEAHVTAGGIVELTQKNEGLVTLVSYLLAGFGIPSRRKRVRKAATNGSGTEREYHTLYVSGSNNLARFENAIGFTVKEKADRLAANARCEPNPNHDTMPTQAAVDELCRQLHLDKGALTTETLNPVNPGRENYLDDVNEVLDAAVEKLEIAQLVLERIDELRSEIERITSVPATWLGERTKLTPLDERKAIQESTGIRSDYLLEYADGRRTPTASRTGRLLNELGTLDGQPNVEYVQNELATAVEQLGVTYKRVGKGVELHGTDVINLLENDDHDVSSLPRFSSVADQVRDLAAGMLSQSVLETIRSLDRLAQNNLYFDVVENVERIAEERRVYDLTIPGTRNYVAGNVPTVMHNTTCATAIARELYGEDWRGNFLELNASDERGIDVVRDRIKNFARANFGGHDYRIIFLDEADSLTSDAQSALRRTMEQFSSNTRFILSCNYSSKIIDPIQSRCAVFRFSPIAGEAVAARIEEIAAEEGIETTDDGVDALIYAADGDMRKAINALQAAAVMGEVVDEDAVFTITSTARPEEIEAMVTKAIEGDFTAARSVLDELLTEKGMAGGDLIDQLHRSVWDFDLDERAAVRLMDRIGEADYRIAEGANERVQLEALLAAIAIEE